MASQQQEPQDAAHIGGRLESWKEIAAFLGKGVRTVQRWEATEQLPIRRHPHEKKSTIYAFKSELLEWHRRRGSALLEQEEAESRFPLNRTRLAVGLVIGTILIVVILAYGGARHWGRPARIDTSTPVSPIRLLTVSGRASQGVLSPAGDRIAFCWNGEHGGDANLDLYIKAIGRDWPRRLTTHPRNDHSPAWSPDGRLIAFLRDEEGVFVMPANGGEEARVLEIRQGEAFSIGMSWSADGRWLVFSYRASENEPFALFALDVVRRGGSPLQRLTTPSADSLADLYPALSPGGDRLAFVRNLRGAGSEVYAVALGQHLLPFGPIGKLTEDQRSVFGIAWLSGDRLVISSDRVGIRRLWVLAVPKADGSRGLLSPFPFAGEDAFQPTVSRTGGRLAYSRRYWISAIWRLTLPREQGEGASSVNLVGSAGDNWDAQVAPNAARIAFVSNRSGTNEIWVSDWNGSKARQMTFLRSPGTAWPRWSPDSKLLLFHSAHKGQSSIYVMPVEGGDPQLVARLAPECSGPSWSRDGRCIYFSCTSAGGTQVWKMPFGGGGDRVLIVKNGGSQPIESVDGKWIYYRRDGIFRMPALGGPEVQMTAGPVGSYDIAGDFLYFDRGFGNFRKAEIWRLNLRTGILEQVTTLGRPKTPGLSVFPGGQSLLFSQMEREASELILIDGVH